MAGRGGRLPDLSRTSLAVSIADPERGVGGYGLPRTSTICPMISWRPSEANGFHSLPITLADGLAAGALPRHHNDPFDRMLVAQARASGLTVVTAHSRLASYGVDVLPA